MQYATKAVSEAWEWMCNLLFRPFNAGKWFAFGLAAWLSSLGHGSLPLSTKRFRPTHYHPRSLQELLPSQHEILAKLAENLAMVITIVTVALCLWLLFMWLSSHGRFLFMSAVTTGELNIKRDWIQNKAMGHSLFVWRLIFALMVILSAVALGISVILGLPLLALSATTPTMLMVCLGLWLTGFLFFVMTVLTIVMLLQDFVIPFMFRFRMSATQAWGYLWQLLKLHFSEFTAYYLIKSLLVLGAAAVAILAILMTCFIALLPYVGTVILLPLYVYFRVYSLCFLGRFHPDLRFDRGMTSM